MRYDIYHKDKLVGTNRIPADVIGSHEPFGVVLVFGEDELLFDIGNVAFAQGDVARVHDNYGHDILGDSAQHYMHQFKDVVSDGNIERVRRMISVAISDVEYVLMKYVNKYIDSVESDEEETENSAPDADTDYKLSITSWKPFSEVIANRLLKLVHEYIIDTVMDDWASLTYPEGQMAWTQKKQTTLGEITRVSHARSVHSGKVKSSLI